jgi:hypothetical protein
MEARVNGSWREEMAKLSIKKLNEQLRPLGVRVRDAGWDELEVLYCSTHNGHVRSDDFIQRTAYFTDDREDALGTGLAMAKHASENNY